MNTEYNQAAPTYSDRALNEQLTRLTNKMKIMLTIGFTLLAVFIPLISMDPMWERFGRLMGISEGWVIIILIAFIGLAVVFIVQGVDAFEKRKAIMGLNVIHGMLHDVFTIVKYEMTEMLPRDLLKETQLNFQLGFYGDDYIQAIYENINFQYSDVEIHLARIGRPVPVMTIKGQWLVIDTKRVVNPPVIISSNSFAPMLEKDSIVEMENVAFNRSYIVSARDSHQAFYVLTPQFMEYLIQRRLGLYQDILICFTQKHIHIFVETKKNFFEPCRNTKNVDQLREKINNEIDFIKGIINAILHDKHLFDPILGQEGEKS